MKRKNSKTPRDFSSVKETSSAPTLAPRLEEYESFKPGDIVYYNVSLTAEKYSEGIIKEIVLQTSGTVVFSIWDTERRMWRSFGSDKVHKIKPHVPRRRSKLE